MKFCNINFSILTQDQIFEREGLHGVKCIATANAQFIVLANSDERFMNYLNKNNVTFDGEIPFKIARLLNHNKCIEKIAGSDLIYIFCKYAEKRKMSLMFLGGDKQSVDGAVKRIMEKYAIQVYGFSPRMEQYPFSQEFIDECRNRINEYRPDIIFIGFGAPKQEFFIEDNYEFLSNLGVKYAIGSGGTVDFVSGKIKRAPKWIQKCGMEGIYRLIKEPSKKRVARLLYSAKFFKYIF